MNKQENFRRFVGMMAGIFLLVTVTCSCETLRKKFKRQKKKEEVTEVQPVLDPIDYPAVVESPEKKYKYHYSLWQVWERDLLRMIEEQENNDKKAAATINAMIVQLEEMQKMVNDERKPLHSSAIGKLKNLQEDFAMPVMMRNRSILQGKLLTIEKEVRHNLKLEKILDGLVGATTGAVSEN